MNNLALIFLIAITIFFPSSYTHAATNTTITMTKDGFAPKEITVDKDATVTFVNADKEDHWPASNIHPTHSIYPEFDPQKPIGPGNRWNFTFTKAGEWKYHDHLNPYFLGTVHVNKDVLKTSGSTSSEGILKNIADYVKHILTQILSLVQKRASPQIELKSPAVRTQFKEPPSLNALNTNDQSVYLDYDKTCANSDVPCISRSLLNITRTYGPQKTLRLIKTLQSERKIATQVDDHQLAHQIGRETAQKFGVNSKAFFLCSTDFNYGCQHGFFEYVLGKTTSGKEAISIICDPIDASYSGKYKFYCYHGAGHGVLMANAYDLWKSLHTCDKLETQMAQDGCWQGVFMENTNAGMRGQARSGIFSDVDPLTPCNTVPEKYRHECFINHAGWLVKYFNYDLEKASRACLNAPGNYISACLESLGLMVTNPSWQETLSKNLNSLDFIGRAWSLCGQFPEKYKASCVIGAVDNLMNFDELDLTRVIEFCKTVEFQFNMLCFKEIGINIRSQTTDVSLVRKKCSSLKGFADSCLSGANL